ncbi:M23 family metallopeptidase [Caldalkalibacillus salinus]|uniref:M23 family metallopeptidase n=1 Tax=Caldalkalibacillus salinus TaxID=2803787 RepID=UPI001921B6E6|nr:M23 family metallopeptidase [Caldalkalibacillus salinus]
MRLRDGGTFTLIGILSICIIGYLIFDTFYNGNNVLPTPDEPPAEEQQEQEGTEDDPDQGEQGQGEQGQDEQGHPQEDDDQRQSYDLSYQEMNGQKWISASELTEAVQGHMEWDKINKTLDLELFGLPFHWIEGVSVVERNGLYLPYELTAIFDEDHDVVYLPYGFLEKGLEVDVELGEEQSPDAEATQLTFYIDESVEEAFSQVQGPSVDLSAMSPDDLIAYLSFLSNPIPDATISTRASHLPGAPRDYRNGYHEGIDWYSGTSGRVIDQQTPVQSVADGTVVRVDHDYVEMTREEREGLLSWSHELDDTPAYILDKLRGMSVWVQYDQGVMIRYAHLSQVEAHLEVGQSVARGDVLGYVGNTGTSYAINGDEDGGLHLHADLLIYGELFWKHINDPDQVRRVLNHTFQD